MANRKKLTGPKRKKFLEHLRKTANVTAASKLIGLTRRRMYQIRDEDEDFAKQWDEVIDEALDNLEAKCFEEAMDGSTPDRLFLLKCRRPEIYRDRATVDHTGHITHDHQHRAVQETDRWIESITSEGETRSLPQPSTH